jgi:hypothetical protein
MGSAGRTPAGGRPPGASRYGPAVGGEPRRAWRWPAGSPCSGPSSWCTLWPRPSWTKGRCGCGQGGCSSGLGSKARCGTRWRRPASFHSRLVHPEGDRAALLALGLVTARLGQPTDVRSYRVGWLRITSSFRSTCDHDLIGCVARNRSSRGGTVSGLLIGIGVAIAIWSIAIIV